MVVAAGKEGIKAEVVVASRRKNRKKDNTIIKQKGYGVHIKKEQLEEIIRLEEEQKKDTARHIPYHIVKHIPQKKPFLKIKTMSEYKKYKNLREIFILHLAGISTRKIAHIFKHDEKTIKYLVLACKKKYPRL